MGDSNRLPGLTNPSAFQFSIFRMLFGVYLFVHFFMLIPYGAEIWSNEGLLPGASLNLSYGVFPNILNLVDAPIHITIFLFVLSILSILFIAGIQRRLIALLLWYGWACLFNRNNLISNPGIPFVGWLLLACAVIPQGEMLFNEKKSSDWKFPRVLLIGAWVIMSISYSISGIDKLQSPSWANGSAIQHLLENPLARDWFLREWMTNLPEVLLNVITWIILGVEILFAPLCLFGRIGRMSAWLLMTGVHFGILLIVDFADLTFGMLMFHFFTFDEQWLGRLKYFGNRYYLKFQKTGN